MKIIKQRFEIIRCPGKEVLQEIEAVARTCYKSEGNMTKDTARPFVEKLIQRGHEAMVEFGSDLVVKFITDRGVSHEIVRHRLCSFAQESTRYVKYSGDMEFILPVWFREDVNGAAWTRGCMESEQFYQTMISSGANPQEARQVLNNSLKTEIVVKANLREWRNIFKLRTSKKAHPQMRELMSSLLMEIKNRIPVIFDDIEVKP